jgi:hypothetical protein
LALEGGTLFKKNHIYLKIFVAEEQYRWLHPVPVPLISPDVLLYLNSTPLLSLIIELEKQLCFQCTDLSLIAFVYTLISLFLCSLISFQDAVFPHFSIQNNAPVK